AVGLVSLSLGLADFHIDLSEVEVPGMGLFKACPNLTTTDLESDSGMSLVSELKGYNLYLPSLALISYILKWSPQCLLHTLIQAIHSDRTS
ncbi:hypothetical protein RRG08_007092, partial [Elysia crispata]